MEQNKFDHINQSSQYNDQIDLIELSSAIWKSKLKIIIVTFLFSIFSVFFSLSLPNIYASDAKMISVDSGAPSSSSLSDSLGGLASFAGISLGSPSADKSILGIEVLKSRNFFNKILKKYDLIVPLMATKGWNKNSNTLIYDEKIYDIANDKWLLDSGQPSSQESYLVFLEKFSVEKNKLTGVITINISHYSPYIAKQWIEIIIKEINSISRNEEVLKAERSIDYLNEVIQTTNLSEVRSGLNNLVQSQVEKIMLAKATPEYLFKIIDPPIVAEKKSQPSRAYICILGFLLGLMISLFYVISNFYYQKALEERNLTNN